MTSVSLGTYRNVLHLPLPMELYGQLKVTSIAIVVLQIPLAETIKELDNFILKGVDLYDHTKVFL